MIALPEIAANPARLADWQRRDEEARHLNEVTPCGAALPGFEAFEVTGCGKNVLLCCAHSPAPGGPYAGPDSCVQEPMAGGGPRSVEERRLLPRHRLPLRHPWRLPRARPASRSDGARHPSAVDFDRCSHLDLPSTRRRRSSITVAGALVYGFAWWTLGTVRERLCVPLV